MEYLWFYFCSYVIKWPTWRGPCVARRPPAVRIWISLWGIGMAAVRCDSVSCCQPLDWVRDEWKKWCFVCRVQQSDTPQHVGFRAPDSFHYTWFFATLHLLLTLKTQIGKSEVLPVKTPDTMPGSETTCFLETTTKISQQHIRPAGAEKNEPERLCVSALTHKCISHSIRTNAEISNSYETDSQIPVILYQLWVSCETENRRQGKLQSNSRRHTSCFLQIDTQIWI